MAQNIIDFEEKRLEKLPPRDAARVLMLMPARKRLESILQRPDAEAVVTSLTDQDFYFTVKELGPDDSLPLIALSRTGQLDHVFDLEWWQKDRVVPARAVEWLERLAGVSETRLLAWLYNADFELLVALFKKWIRVATAPEDIDLVEAREQLPPHTLDDQFFWESFYPQFEDLISRVLGMLFEVNYGFYKELMNHILWTIGVEVEEDAYRFHRGRLEDRAIPDYYDALRIYSPLRVDDLPHGKREDVVLRGSALPAPSYALRFIPEKDLLHRALQTIDEPPILDGLQVELAALASKVIVADQLSVDDADALRQAVAVAAAYVNLGLSVKCGDDVESAAVLLKDVFLEHLFRAGRTQVSKLGNAVRRLSQDGWISRWPAGIRILDPPWADAADLLLQKTPRIFRPRPETHLPPREDFFRDKADLLRGKHLVDIIAALGPVFDSFRPDPESLARKLWPDGQIAGISDITVGVLLWTAAARVQLERNWQPDPLPVGVWPELFPKLSPDAVEEIIRSRVDELIPRSSNHISVRAYLNTIFKAYSDEMNRYGDRSIPDPAMVRFFLFSRK